MRDQAYVQETCALTAQIRDRFSDQIRALGLTVPQSRTNFALIRFASPTAAASADAFLRAEGVVLRPQGGAGLPECLRATAGVANDMELAASLLKDWHEREGRS